MKRLLMSIVCVASLLTASLAFALPLEMPLQGVLRDNAGAPVAAGTFEMTFAIYADAESDEALWTEVRQVTAQGGQFRVNLGVESPLDPSIFAASGALWLGVSVEGEPELPRRPMGTTPYAFQATSAQGLACSGCVEPDALSDATVQMVREQALQAVSAAGYASQATQIVFDDSSAEIGATTVQSALETLQGLIANQQSASNVNEGAGTVRSYSNQWGLPSYGVAKEYVHVINPNPPKVLLHLYGGENTGFASSNNLIVSNTYTPNTYSGGVNGAEGADTLSVNNAGAFNQGDHILIHQSVGQEAGQWELNAVQAINGNSLKLAKPLSHNYASDSSSTTGSMNRAQVVIAASYNTFEVVNGGVVRPSSDLSSGTEADFYGGIVYIRARQMTVKNGGVIEADSRGYVASGSHCCWNTAIAGDSECGTSVGAQQTNNCSGGGGGHATSCCCSSGSNYGSGGGGNKTAGATGYNNNGGQSGGTGGLAKGVDGAGELHFGGAGGEVGPGYRGGNGGGIVVLGADTLIVESGARISARGGDGRDVACRAGSGGGAGGTVALFATTISTEGDVLVNGGQGFNHTHASAHGGDGGEGWLFELDPVPGIVNQSYATGVEIWVDGQEVTPLIGDPNGKGMPHWNDADKAWGGSGTEAWSSGPLDLSNVASWTLGEHTVEFKETGGAGGDLKAYLYMIQTFSESTPPVNDNCTTPVAIDLSEGPVVLSGTTEDVMGKTKATDANSAECGGTGGADVTYSITLTERSLINVATVSPFPMRMYLRDGDCTDGEVVYCADGDFSTTPFEPGTYYLIVDSDEAQAKGDFTLAVSLTPALLPENDTCDTAMELFFSNVNIATDVGSTLYSLDQSEAWCGGADGPDVVYKFTAPSGYKIDILVESDEFDPILHLYTEGCAAQGDLDECVASNALTTNPQPGGDYWLIIDSAGEGQWGAFDLTIAFIQ
jgi:hypothetical protein